jgi:hypothetical protein
MFYTWARRLLTVEHARAVGADVKFMIQRVFHWQEHCFETFILPAMLLGAGSVLQFNDRWNS